MTLVKCLEWLDWQRLFADSQSRPEFSNVINFHFLQQVGRDLSVPTRYGGGGDLSFEYCGPLRHGLHRKVFVVSMLDDESQNFLWNPARIPLDYFGHLGRWNIKSLLSNEKTNIVSQLLVEIWRLMSDLRFDVNRENTPVRGSRVDVFVKKGEKFVFRDGLDILNIRLV